MPSVRELQARVSSREFAEWVAFWEQEPFGERVLQVQLATLCALVANAFRDTKARPAAYTAEDFLPGAGGVEPGGTSPELIWAQIKGWAQGRGKGQAESTQLGRKQGAGGMRQEA